MFCDRCGHDNRDEARFCKRCGADMGEQRTDAPLDGDGGEGGTARTVQKIGSVISGRYLIEAELGRGGMGIVYKAMDQELERPVALKVLHPRVAKREAAVKQLREEALAAMKITHQNLVRLHNFENAPDAKYLLMEYVPGQSLAKMLSNGLAAGFTERDVVRIAQQVCDALIAAHKAGVIHRDIKPSNILITPEGQVKIVDLGIAAAHEPGNWGGTAGSSAGTPTYMAPEQFERQRVDGRTDVYATGATLYEILASHPPFVGGDLKEQHLHEVPEPIPGVSDWLNELVLRCLAKSPKDRFPTAEALRKALDGVGDAAGVPLRATKQTDNEPEWRRVARERDLRDKMLRAEKAKNPSSAGSREDEMFSSPGASSPHVVMPQRAGALPPVASVTPFASGIDVVMPSSELPGGPGGGPSSSAAVRIKETRRSKMRPPRTGTEPPMQWGIPAGVLQYAVGSALFATLAAIGAWYWADRAGASSLVTFGSQVALGGAIGLFWGFAERMKRDLFGLLFAGLGAGCVAGLFLIAQGVTPDADPVSRLVADVLRAVVFGGGMGAALGVARRSGLAAGLAGAMGAGGGLLAAMLLALGRLQLGLPAGMVDALVAAFLLGFLVSFGAAVGANSVRVHKDFRMRL